MGPAQSLANASALAREQRRQREGRRSRARTSHRCGGRPTAGTGGRGWKHKARRSAAAAPLPANEASWRTGDPPSWRGAELSRLSYPYGACLHLRICESWSSRKLNPHGNLHLRQRQKLRPDRHISGSRTGNAEGPKNRRLFPVRPRRSQQSSPDTVSASLPVLAEG